MPFGGTYAEDYTIPRTERELQQDWDTQMGVVDYTIPRTERELQLDAPVAR